MKALSCWRWFGIRILGVACLALSATHVQADFVGVGTANGFVWDRPTVSGGPATFQAWESFASTTGPNAPQTVFGAGTGNPSAVTTGTGGSGLGFGGGAGATWNAINAAGVANIFNTSGDSFLTSGGNIYSPTGIVTPRIFVPNNIDNSVGNQIFGSTYLTLQVRTQGSLPDLNSFRLTDPVSGSLVAPRSISVLATQVLGGFGGTLQDTIANFLVAGNADLYQIDFSAGSSSLSLDRVAVDTHYSSTSSIPEPSSLALLSVVAIFGSIRRRIRSC